MPPANTKKNATPEVKTQGVKIPEAGITANQPSRMYEVIEKVSETSFLTHKLMMRPVDTKKSNKQQTMERKEGAPAKHIPLPDPAIIR